MITWSELKRAAQQAHAPSSSRGATRGAGIQIARALVPDSDPSPVSTGLCESGEFSTEHLPHTHFEHSPHFPPRSFEHSPHTYM